MLERIVPPLMYTWWLGVFLCTSITFVGTFGDSLTLAIFVKFKKFRNVIGALICNLTIVNLATSALVLPINAEYVFGTADFLLTAEQYCYCVKIVGYGLTQTSVMTIGVITANRGIKICCQSYIYDTIFTKKKTALLIALCWISGFAVPVCVAYGIGGKIYMQEVGAKKYCVYLPQRAFYVHLFAVVAVILIMMICYWNIYRRVKQSRNALQGSSSGSTHIPNFKLERMIFVTTSTFFICYLPLTLISFVRRGGKVMDPEAIFFFLLPIFLSAIIDPIIYCFSHSKYFEAYKELLLSCKETISPSPQTTRVNSRTRSGQVTQF